MSNPSQKHTGLFGPARRITGTAAPSLEVLQRRDMILQAVAFAAEQFLAAIDWEASMPAVLARLGLATEASRAYVFSVSGPEEDPLATLRYEWLASNIDPEAGSPHPADIALKAAGYARWVALLANGLPVNGSTRSFPLSERVLLDHQGIQSLFIAPITIGSSWWGFIGFEDWKTARDWPPAEADSLEAAARMVGAGIQRQRLSSALRSSELRRTALLDAIPDQIFRLNRRADILDYRPGRGPGYALPREQMIGQNLSLFFPPQLVALALETIAATLDTGELQTVDYSLPQPDGLQYFEARLVVSGSDEVVALVRNVTERAKLEQMKDDFVHRAAHELRTPLATAILMADLIHEGGAVEEVEGYWRILHAEQRRQRTLIEKLLTVGRLDSGGLDINPTPVDLAAVCAEALNTTDTLSRAKSIAVSVDLARGLPAVLGDDDYLQQVFVNLLTNAIKFTPEKGRIVVTIRPEAGGVTSSVADTGIGIPVEDRPHLFERFFRASNATKREIQGTGVGLYIVRSIVERLNGRISVQSELNRGTVVSVWLPAAR